MITTLVTCNTFRALLARPIDSWTHVGRRGGQDEVTPYAEE